MAAAPHHRITVCTSCRTKGTQDRPGFAVIDRLRDGIARAGDSLPAPFEVAGVACMAGCDRPCTVAYSGPGKASYLFGDIEPDQDIGDLLQFARQYGYLHDGWCSSVDRPGKLRKSTLARVPALHPAAAPKDEERDQ